MSVHSAKFGQMHAAAIIMATENHVPQFSYGGERIILIIRTDEIDILLFLRGKRAHKSPIAYATVRAICLVIYE